VNQEDQEQPDLDDHNQRIAFQDERVLVEDGGAEEHQKVSGDVDDEIDGEGRAGDADEQLHPDRRTERADA